MDLFGLDIDVLMSGYEYSYIDACKGVVTSSNIDNLCACGLEHTLIDNVLFNFRTDHPGNHQTTTIYWTGHRVITNAGAGNTQENRSAWDENNILMLLRNTEDRDNRSKASLMHELCHEFGAPDHYHEIVGGQCKNKAVCSECGDNKRPEACLMFSSDKDINDDAVLCDACMQDIIEYLRENH